MVIYKNDYKISVEEFRDILKESTLAERRPVDNLKILSLMVKNADIVITAWDEKKNKIIGIARSISDFSYCTYLSDLAVHKDYQRIGIGKQLVFETEKVIEPGSLLFLISAPKANEYYPKVGFETVERVWKLHPSSIK